MEEMTRRVVNFTVGDVLEVTIAEDVVVCQGDIHSTLTGMTETSVPQHLDMFLRRAHCMPVELDVSADNDD
eukprot:jgi/Tetstr1/465730/TSEL_010355.t1